MKHKTIKLCFALFLYVAFSSAQDVIATAGDEIASAGGSINYTIGQLFFSENVSASGSETQGIQQSSQSGTLGIPSLNTPLVAVFPNPAIEEIHIQVKDSNSPLVHYYLYDQQGRLLMNNPIVSSTHKIELQNLQTGTYLLKITAKNARHKAFKIIKK